MGLFCWGQLEKFNSVLGYRILVKEPSVLAAVVSKWHTGSLLIVGQWSGEHSLLY